MSRLDHIFASALLALALGPLAAAQSFTIGAWQGARGVGISAHVPQSESAFNSYCIAIDFEGLVFSHTAKPGFRMHFAHLVEAADFETSQTRSLSLYYGPGVMTGVVSNLGPDKKSYIEGLALCLCAIGGVKAQFDRNVEMSLEWGIDLGVHLSPSSKPGMVNSSLFYPGLTRFMLPQLKLHYMF